MVSEVWSDGQSSGAIPIHLPATTERVGDFIERVSEAYRVQRCDRLKGRVSEGGVQLYVVRQHGIA